MATYGFKLTEAVNNCSLQLTTMEAAKRKFGCETAWRKTQCTD